MNKVNSKKFLNTKWTSVTPSFKEKHFLISKIEKDENGIIVECIIEAIITNNTYSINWRDLKNQDQWVLGWSR